MSVSQDDSLTFDRLTSEQRAVAWAVVRSVATALWVGVTAMGFVWILVAASRTTVALWSLPALIGAIGLALVMEVKSPGSGETARRSRPFLTSAWPRFHYRNQMRTFDSGVPMDASGASTRALPSRPRAYRLLCAFRRLRQARSAAIAPAIPGAPSPCP